MKIQVLGTGCHKCKTLAQVTEQAVSELGIAADISKVTDLKEIMAMGVMMTPALVHRPLNMCAFGMPCAILRPWHA